MGKAAKAFFLKDFVVRSALQVRETSRHALNDGKSRDKNIFSRTSGSFVVKSLSKAQGSVTSSDAMMTLDLLLGHVDYVRFFSL